MTTKSTQNPTTTSTGSCLTKLFDHCKNDLPKEELDWLDGVADVAILEADNLGETLNLLAELKLSPDSRLLLTDDRLSAILYGLADRAGTIAALIQISSDAAYRLNELASKNAGQ